MRSRRSIVVMFVALTVGPASACIDSLPAHPGRTDETGCHGQKDGGRHCHQAKSIKPAAELAGTVEKVVDGDTIKVRLPDGKLEKVRFKGIDCPESHRNAKCRRDQDCASDIVPGKRAAGRATELLAKKKVRLVSALSRLERDRYGRLLAYVELEDGTDVGLKLLREGLCVDYSHKFPHPRQDAYLKAMPAGQLPSP